MVISLTPAWARYSFMQPTFRNLVAEGYKGNGAVFACISALAFAFPEPPLLVWEENDAGKTPLREHPLSLLLKRPNPQMGLARLLLFTIVYLALGGNCYWYKVRSRAGRVVELWPLHDGQMQPVAGTTRLIDHYEFDNGSGAKPLIIPVEDVVHFMWMPDPLAPWRGLAPLIAVAREVDTDNEATRYLFSLLKNDAMPRLAITVPENVDMSDTEKRKRLKEEWQQNRGGENRGGVALLEGGLDIKVIAMNLKELEFNMLRFVPEARMCGAFRVPVAVAGVYVGLEKSTYNNQSGQFEFFTDRTLIPLWGAIDDQVQFDLLPEFGGTPSQVVEFDLDKVQVLAERKTVKRQWALDALSRGGATVNEFRSVAGLPRDANGDVYLRGLAMVAEPFVGEGRGKKDEGRRMKDEGDPGASTGSASSWQKAEGGPSTSSGRKAKRKAQEAVIAAQRSARREVAGRMASAVDGYFGGLADRVIHRARKGWTEQAQAVQTKALPEADDLLTNGDEDELLELVKRFYTELIQLSWGYWDVALGVDTVLDLTDPLVTEILAGAGERVKQIQETTLKELRILMQYGNDNGWSIDHLLRGDPENGIPGLRDLIEETYKNRARTIARTELGNAQNTAAVGRYEAAGGKEVFVLDNGLGDDDEPCQVVNGTVQTLKWAEEHPLEHPNCTRAFAPEF